MDRRAKNSPETPTSTYPDDLNSTEDLSANAAPANTAAAASAPIELPDNPTTAYKDPDLPVGERVEELLARMTLEEKIGQMTLIEKGSIKPDDISKRFIGGLLSGGGGSPTGNNTPEGWAGMVDGFQGYAMQTRLEIPLIYGVDAVHGHANMHGAVVFPHNIGLGAANNPELMREIGRVTAQ